MLHSIKAEAAVCFDCSLKNNLHIVPCVPFKTEKTSIFLKTCKNCVLGWSKEEMAKSLLDLDKKYEDSVRSMLCTYIPKDVSALILLFYQDSNHWIFPLDTIKKRKFFQTSTRVVNKQRTKLYDVYIGRPGKFGNPFVIGKDGNREQVLAKYKKWMFAPSQIRLRQDMKRELQGKTLACWCAPLPCHGDVIASFVDSNDLL